ncbi:MAG: hypothetical protein ACRDHZ_19775 [Ktedonobacteraceae bacterium]
MHRTLKTLALSILGIALVSLDLVVWAWMHLPFGLETLTLELNHLLLPCSVLIRGAITSVLVWAFLYVHAHCVVVNREESVRIVTRG